MIDERKNLLKTIEARGNVILDLHRELARKKRQLAEARYMIRMALKYGVTSVVDRGHLTEGCARDTRTSLEQTLPKLDDRRKKRSAR